MWKIDTQGSPIRFLLQHEKVSSITEPDRVNRTGIKTGFKTGFKTGSRGTTPQEASSVAETNNAGYTRFFFCRATGGRRRATLATGA